MAQVKQDPDAMYIKQDPDDKKMTLADFDDDDLYEDAGDLDFSAANQHVWMSRLPRQLWENWAQIDDDEEIEIGTIRIEGEPNDLKRVSLRLHDRPDNKDIPKDYILQQQTVTSTNASHMTQNTFVFTEKDVPGAENRMAVFGETRSALYEAMKRDARRREQGKKWEPYMRKTVPKQTALIGRVSEEFNCLPVENEEFRRISERRALDALKPKKETRFIEKIPTHILQSRHALPVDTGNFVQASRLAKSKSQENKSTRIAQNELLDMIFDCFRQYQYWPFKALKAKTLQPEAYLKQTLEMVAHLVKSGDFAMTWELKPEARQANYAAQASYAKAELAPAPENYDDASDDDPTASGVATDHDEMMF
ncbi:Transcription initiation factor IIF beta subunit [Penicillium herquei]|nr:Transcription initiation factor IIF beta subunit [Penicillium herquei]KAJ5708504.1 Transcription initiation factor IIF beta subunit [Penicillium malachiteum]